MMNYVEDMFGNTVSLGETLIVPRPAAAGTGYKLEFCRLLKVNAQSITVQPLDANGNPKTGTRYNANASGVHPPFTVRIKETYGDSIRLAKYTL